MLITSREQNNCLYHIIHMSFFKLEVAEQYPWHNILKSSFNLMDCADLIDVSVVQIFFLMWIVLDYR
jgi:hypothetical protein